MDVSHIINESMDPVNPVCREESAKEFWRLVKMHGFIETMEAVMKEVYKNPKVCNFFENLSRQGFSRDERARILVSTIDAMLKKMLFNQNPT